MATVSRHSAVVKVGPIEFSGYFAWLCWLFLHLAYMVGFKARIVTAFSWLTTFIGSQRGQLTITEQQAYARTRIEQLEEIVESVEEDPQIARY
jgi:NADH dehydrogenase